MDVDRILSELCLDDCVEMFVSEAEERELLSSPTPTEVEPQVILAASAPASSNASAPAPLTFGPNPSAPPRQSHPKPLIPPKLIPKMTGRKFKTRNFRVKNVERLTPIPEVEENPRRRVALVPPSRNQPTRHHSRGPWVLNPLARKPPMSLMDIKFDETSTQSRRLPSLKDIGDFRQPQPSRQNEGRVSRQFSYGNRHDDGITRATRR